ncbi:hypothetical protein BDV96DRAFT_21249 [Lophiotrema nucula]|uniref:Uncharacterized protein n=1 Tax=Lophiotrema nucula TaxID=690887 RepID=A0A6A5ZEQ9_9PLEO|nr:hypothetical protein BDV96DRAFT_21249 [Lophiotrema nucula]
MQQMNAPGNVRPRDGAGRGRQQGEEEATNSNPVRPQPDWGYNTKAGSWMKDCCASGIVIRSLHPLQHSITTKAASSLHSSRNTNQVVRDEMLQRDTSVTHSGLSGRALTYTLRPRPEKLAMRLHLENTSRSTQAYHRHNSNLPKLRPSIR